MCVSIYSVMHITMVGNLKVAEPEPSSQARVKLSTGKIAFYPATHFFHLFPLLL